MTQLTEKQRNRIRRDCPNIDEKVEENLPDDASRAQKDEFMEMVWGYTTEAGFRHPSGYLRSPFPYDGMPKVENWEDVEFEDLDRKDAFLIPQQS